MRFGFIYKISTINNKHFIIGSTLKVNQRFANYKSLLRKNKCPNSYLQSVWNKYGEGFFKFEILQENIPESILLFLEDIWMSVTCSLSIYKMGGLNLQTASRPEHNQETKDKISKNRKGKCKGKENSFFNKKHTKESLEKISLNTTKNKVLQYDLEGNFVKEWISVETIKKELKISVKGVYKCVRGFSKQSYGFMWIYKKENDFPLKIKKYNFVKNSSWLIKKVYEINKNQELIKIWDNKEDFAEHIGVSIATINRAFNGDFDKITKYRDFYFTKNKENVKINKN